MKTFIIAILMVFLVAEADARPHRPRRPRKPPQKIQEKENPYKFVKNFDVLLLKYSNENYADINRINTKAIKYHRVTRVITYPDSQIPILVSQSTYEKLKADKVFMLRLSPSIEADEAIQTDIVQN